MKVIDLLEARYKGFINKKDLEDIIKEFYTKHPIEKKHKLENGTIIKAAGVYVTHFGDSKYPGFINVKKLYRAVTKHDNLPREEGIERLHPDKHGLSIMVYALSFFSTWKKVFATAGLTYSINDEWMYRQDENL